MHPWTKAYRDVYSKDELETLFSIEKQMKDAKLEKTIASLHEILDNVTSAMSPDDKEDFFMKMREAFVPDIHSIVIGE